MKSPLGIIIISEQWLQPLKLPPGAKLPAEDGADAGWLGKPSFANASDAALNSAAAITPPKILGLCLLFFSNHLQAWQQRIYLPSSTHLFHGVLVHILKQIVRKNTAACG
ncbi:hypothetical protein HXP36_24655 [Ralstonia solanacearum]|uniref:hypothetical protein n=1 Tax=Ralstonia solanacearum TaxID=305 RepID=UPI0016231209|nr:hypothetical protein [Ralstonia solanacearum]MBB6584910.1 hypothetical protein [Ralstonia solanacearum]